MSFIYHHLNIKEKAVEKTLDRYTRRTFQYVYFNLHPILFWDNKLDIKGFRAVLPPGALSSPYAFAAFIV